MKLLFLSITVPFPATDGGRLRVLNLLKQIAQRNRVTFLALETQPTDGEGIEYLQSLGIKAHLVSSSSRLPIINLRCGSQAVLKRKPLTVARYDVPAFRQTFHSMLETGSFNLIHYEMFHTGQYHLETNAKSLLSLQNVDSHIWRRLREQTSNPLRGCLFRTQERAFRRYERTMSNRFDLVACTSEIDRELMEGICPGLSADVIPNGVDTELYQPNHEVEEETTIIFTGSMDWFPNEDAAIYFIDEILPAIQIKRPNLKFYVVGQFPSERLKRYGNRPGVVVTGRVDDVKPYIARATVYVVPLRIGGGTRLKILEALAMGKAVVSTSVGAEGLNLTVGDEIVVADDSTQFADGVIQLMEDKSKRRKLGENGRRRVEAIYDWRRIGEKLQGLYEAVAAGESATTGKMHNS